MKRRLQFFTMLTVFGLALSPPVRAQTLDELKAQIQSMQREIKQLQAQQRRGAGRVQRQGRAYAPRGAPAAQGSETQRAAQAAQAAAAQAQQAQQNIQLQIQQAKQDAVKETLDQFKPPPGKPGGLTVRLPGINTTVRVYGFVKLNATTDLSTRDRSDALTAQSIQLRGSAGARQGGDTQFSARRSRIGLETWTPLGGDWGDLHTQLEADFAGGTISANAPATGGSYIPRLRLAYADFGKTKGGFGNFLFGQQASTFSDLALVPIQWMSDWDFVGISNVRQAQFRYTYGWANGLSASAAVESPYGDVGLGAGQAFPDVSVTNTSGSVNAVATSTSPDFAARLLWQDPKIGLLALRGVVRPQIMINNNAAGRAFRLDRGTTGWGVGVTGVVNLLDGKLVLVGTGNAGRGLGRYLTSTAVGFGAVSNLGVAGVSADDASVNAVDVYGGLLGAEYFFTPTLRTNLAIGGARLGYPNYASLLNSTSVNTSMWAASINLVWSPFKNVDLGIEYQHVERALLRQPGLTSPLGGVANRIQLTAIGKF